MGKMKNSPKLGALAIFRGYVDTSAFSTISYLCLLPGEKVIQFDLRLFFKWFESASYLEPSHDLYLF